MSNTATVCESSNPNQGESPFCIVEPGKAWDYYTKPEQGRGSLRYYLNGEMLGKVVDALGKPLCLEQLQMIVADDGEPVTCALCKKEFQPVKTLHVSDPRFLAELRNGTSFEDAVQMAWENDVVIFGSFYYDPETHAAPVPACGSPWTYLPAQKIYVRRNSCLTRAWTASGPDNQSRRWGLCHADQQFRCDIVTQERHEAKQREILRQQQADRRARKNAELNEAAQRLFGGCGKPGRGCVRKAS